MSTKAFWNILAHECHTHSEQMQLELGTLLDMIPDPDNHGINAHTFLKMILRLETLHAQDLHEEIKYLERDDSEAAALKKVA